MPHVILYSNQNCIGRSVHPSEVASSNHWECHQETITRQLLFSFVNNSCSNFLFIADYQLIAYTTRINIKRELGSLSVCDTKKKDHRFLNIFSFSKET